MSAYAYAYVKVWTSPYKVVSELRGVLNKTSLGAKFNARIHQLQNSPYECKTRNYY